MADYIERVSFVGWLSRILFQVIWVSFLLSINPSNQSNHENEHTTINLTKRSNFKNKCSTIIFSVITFLLNALQFNCSGNPVDMTFGYRCRNKSILFVLTDIGD
ncbi:unnamed protein product [Rotaria sp. Silwood2]|nr:unnamed protein product [Rotaria sp. Silwood2]CAF4150048.1 unnamed protein product [Rotaria sp. Silwood2]